MEDDRRNEIEYILKGCDEYVLCVREHSHEYEFIISSKTNNSILNEIVYGNMVN